MISRIVIALLVLHAVWVEFEIHEVVFKSIGNLQLQDLNTIELMNTAETRLSQKIDHVSASLENLGEVVMPGSKERIKKIKEDTLRDLMKSGGK